MTKTSDLSALAGASIDAANDHFPVIDDSLVGIARSKKMTFAELVAAFAKALTDPNADRILFWDDSAGVLTWLTLGSGLSITGTTITGTSPAPAIQSVSSSATVTPTFDDDLVKITAQAAGLTLANPTGTAVPGRGMAIRIKDNGTARSIAYGTQYRAIGVTLPTTTVISKTLYLGLIYNSDDTKWDVVAVAQEA